MTTVDSGAGVEGRLAALLASDPDLLADPYSLYAELRERASRISGRSPTGCRSS